MKDTEIFINILKVQFFLNKSKKLSILLGGAENTQTNF